MPTARISEHSCEYVGQHSEERRRRRDFCRVLRHDHHFARRCSYKLGLNHHNHEIAISDVGWNGPSYVQKEESLLLLITQSIEKLFSLFKTKEAFSSILLLHTNCYCLLYVACTCYEVTTVLHMKVEAAAAQEGCSKVKQRTLCSYSRKKDDFFHLKLLSSFLFCIQKKMFL